MPYFSPFQSCCLCGKFQPCIYIVEMAFPYKHKANKDLSGIAACLQAELWVGDQGKKAVNENTQSASRASHRSEIVGWEQGCLSKDCCRYVCQNSKRALAPLEWANGNISWDYLICADIAVRIATASLPLLFTVWQSTWWPETRSQVRREGT